MIRIVSCPCFSLLPRSRRSAPESFPPCRSLPPRPGAFPVRVQLCKSQIIISRRRKRLLFQFQDSVIHRQFACCHLFNISRISSTFVLSLCQSLLLRRHLPAAGCPKGLCSGIVLYRAVVCDNLSLFTRVRILDAQCLLFHRKFLRNFPMKQKATKRQPVILTDFLLPSWQLFIL